MLQDRTIGEHPVRNVAMAALIGLIVLGSLIGSLFAYREARHFTATTNLPLFPQRPSDAAELPQVTIDLPAVNGEDTASGGEPSPTSLPGEAPITLPDDPNAPAPPAATEAMTVLVMGIDRRENEEGPWRSDAMILLSVDPVQQRVAMLSIPRDLYVTLPDYGDGEYLNRINTALFYGDFADYPGGGPALAKETIRENFGIAVDRYVLMDFDGFRRLIDEIGGVDICVPQRIVDREYPTEEGGTMTVRFEPGYQHMDGERALIYSRTRKSTSDFARAERQQQVVLAVRNRVLSLDILPSLTPARLASILTTLDDSIRTDLSIDEILSLAQLARSIRSENIDRLVIDNQMVLDYMTEAGAEVLLPRWELILPAVSATFDVPLDVQIPVAARLTVAPTSTPKRDRATSTTSSNVTPTPSGPTIVVLNGSSTIGVEADVAEQLEDAGLRVADTGYAQSGPYPTTQIVVYDRTMLTTAQAIQSALALPDGSILFGASRDRDVGVTVIVGEEWSAGVSCPTP